MKGGGNKDGLNRTRKRVCNEVCSANSVVDAWMGSEEEDGAIWMIRYPMSAQKLTHFILGHCPMYEMVFSQTLSLSLTHAKGKQRSRTQLPLNG